LQGHFPDDPIVPGALLLTYVLGSLRARYSGQINVTGLQNVKFLSIVRPEEPFSIQYQVEAEKLRFGIIANGVLKVKGNILYESAK
jgi:3-hydroxymyristoyl/3-hydroxydecanoyl-(acyl carrier protein) dehydratase